MTTARSHARLNARAATRPPLPPPLTFSPGASRSLPAFKQRLQVRVIIEGGVRPDSRYCPPFLFFLAFLFVYCYCRCLLSAPSRAACVSWCVLAAIPYRDLLPCLGTNKCSRESMRKRMRVLFRRARVCLYAHIHACVNTQTSPVFTLSERPGSSFICDLYFCFFLVLGA